MPRTPTLWEVISGSIRSKLDEVMTSTVGKVMTYYPLTQTADIKPVMRRPFPVGQGFYDHEELPIIMNVPVRQPRAGGFFIHMPVEPGDHVLLIFTHDDIAPWRTTGSESEPEDLRRHSLGSCVALVGMADALSFLPVTDPAEVLARAGGLVIGREGSHEQIQWGAGGFIQVGRPTLPGTPVSPVALAVPTDARLTALEAAVGALVKTVGDLSSAMSAHTHPAPGGATSVSADAGDISSPGDAPSGPSTASNILKAT